MDEGSPTNRLEARLWAAADALHNNMDAAEYKHVFLGLIFLKYISNAFELKHAELKSQRAEGADPEDPDEYRAGNIFWVPPEARWERLKASAPQPTIGTLVDEAMTAIERDNPSLKGVLPKDYARPGLDKQRSVRLSTWSAISDWEDRPIGRATFLDASTSTPSPSSPARKARRAASFTRRPGWSAFSSKCSPLQGTCVRPLLWLRRHVCFKRELHRSPQRQVRGHLHLRSGVQLHHLAVGEDEPRNTRVSTPRSPPWRQLPQRPPWSTLSDGPAKGERSSKCQYRADPDPRVTAAAWLSGAYHECGKGLSVRGGICPMRC